MPEIKAFRGWRYEKGRVGKLADVLAPPYDVISAKQQEEFYKKNPHNVIRLILGKKLAADSARSNQYTRARDFLNDWISKGILVQDALPSIYVILQDYKEGGKAQTRLGFMAAMRIDEKAALKHENTLAKPKKDRWALLKEVQTNLSPIFGLFEDKKAQIQRLLKKSLKSTPDLDVTIEGVRHRLYVENHEENLKRLCIALMMKPMFIADGHHRFEVACQFRRWMESRQAKVRHKACLHGRQAGEAGWNYVMTYFSDCMNNPIKIFPTHRLVKVPNGVKEALMALAERGKLEKVGARRAAPLQVILKTLVKPRSDSNDKRHRFGIYAKNHGFYIFTLDGKFSPMAKKNPVDRLDVAVLHKQLIEPCFKIRVVEKSAQINFTRDPGEAKAEVDAGRFDLAFFLRPTSLNEMILASKKGLKMPQKSTYFYPKLLSGLVFHRFDEGSS